MAPPVHQWHGVFLGGGVAAHKPSVDMLVPFALAFAAAGQPDDMAIFSHKEPGTDEITLYFSPAAANFARRFFPNISPCERPSRANLGLSAGSQLCWSLLFPDE